MSKTAWALTRGSTFKKSTSTCQTYDYVRTVKRRRFTTSIPTPSPKTDDDLENGSGGGVNKTQFGPRAQEKLADRQFFLDLLASASTKREAKGYLSRFRGSGSRPKAPIQPIEKQEGARNVKEADTGLLGLMGHARAVDESPVFSQTASTEWTVPEQLEPLHLALIKIRAPQELDDTTLEGVGSTLSQLNRLGMGCCVVVDMDESGEYKQARKALVIKQADRVAAAIDRHPGPGSRRLDNVIGVPTSVSPSLASSPPSLDSHVLHRKLLLTPLRRGIIPVLSPVAYTDRQIAVTVPASDVMMALAKEFAGLGYKPSQDQDPLNTKHRIDALQKGVSLDRVILIDPLGGIPSGARDSSAHVFINMEQEYNDIRNELVKMDSENHLLRDDSHKSESPGPSPAQLHMENLQLLKNALALLPPSSSGIVTCPQDAANSSQASTESFEVSAVGTRRQKNPLIHNLLTDKPMVSSSLPSGRLGPLIGAVTAPPVSYSYPTTLSKRGMPLTILPNPHVTPWRVENVTKSKLSLHDSKVDLPRLVHLIEDSFGRKLDVEHYLNRVNDRIAGLIVAGEYEGGAILTWETPPGVDENIDNADPSRLVPYLDKFAVLKRSQGAGGVADILFNAMVRDCFPNGVCWRSRRDNPVNKWYFERARGTWKMPDTNWTMFWTTEGVEEKDGGRAFLDYEGVCRGVQPSWADTKSVVD